MSAHTIALAGRTVGEIATEHPGAIRVFQQWGIDYCCGGATPVESACERSGRSVADLETALAATASTPGSGIEHDWSRESLASLAAFIIDAYHRYTREELETLTALAEKVEGVHGQRHPEVRRVRELVQALVGDMTPHMLKEEQVLFPFVDQLEEAADQGRPAPTPFFGTVRNPVRMMMMEHDAVADLLRDLRLVTSDYAPPADACFSYGELYRRLALFETKTHEHIHLENNVYFPKAVKLEDEAGKPIAHRAAETGHACGCGH